MNCASAVQATTATSTPTPLQLAELGAATSTGLSAAFQSNGRRFSGGSDSGSTN